MKNKLLIPKIPLLILLLAIFTVFLTCTNNKTKVKKVFPVLEFPQMGIDDPSAYYGYSTRFFQDSKGNTVQILINKNTGRIVNIWADAANESMSFTARDTSGQPAIIKWSSADARITSIGQTRFIQYTLSSEVPALDIGLFMLASMRVERDYQYFQRHLLPFGTEKYIEHELSKLIQNLERLPANIRLRHLSLLNVENINELRSRLAPRVKLNKNGLIKSVLVEQPTFDGKNHLSLELSVDGKYSVINTDEEKISVRSLQDKPIQLIIKIGTDSPSLTPQRRNDFFKKKFLQFYKRAKVKHDSFLLKTNMTPQKAIKNEQQLRFIRLERQVKSIELLSCQEKLMAGLPNYATYFGRDMMMSALMMEPICSPEMLEHVIASVLKKLSPSGEVSHEEALGGQAIRENAAKYNNFIIEYLHQKTEKDYAKANSVLEQAEKILGNLQAVVENYRMVDDDFQLPVLVARYLTRPDITVDRKRAFLLANSGKVEPVTRLSLLMRNFQYISRVTRSYVEHPETKNLVSFTKLNEQRWSSASWRDSGAGYANGRFAMDVNAIWVPKALESMEKVFTVLKEIGFTNEKLESAAPEINDTVFGQYLNRPETLQQAIKIWQTAIKHFEVHLSQQQVQRKVNAKLDWLPEEECDYWGKIITKSVADKQDIEFLALSLDGKGKPILVANTDPATLLFLEDFTKQILDGKASSEEVIKRLKIFTIPYPVGLFVEGLGPLVANDAYASPEIWESFKRDHYHSPRVVWGREVNLLILGLSKQILAAYDSQGNIKSPTLESYVEELNVILSKIINAVESSGFKHNELWGFQIKDGKLVPMRYAISCDIQLWNLTNLAVQFLLARISNL